MNIRFVGSVVFSWSRWWIVAHCLIATSVATPVNRNRFTETIFASSPSLARPTGLEWAPDGSGRLFVIRKEGQVRVIENGVLQAQPFATVSPIFTGSECGLLGICFDPDFTANGYVYLFVTVSASEQRIVRYVATRDVSNNSVGEQKTNLVSNLPTQGANHNGGGIGIGPDGHIYWSIGDNGSRTGVDNDLLSLASKVGRANRHDGSAPIDNPFYDGTGSQRNYIWARGLRNPFTLSFQPITGKLWVNCVGESYEQIFKIRRGVHCGWDDFEANQAAGFQRPVIKYRTNGVDSRYVGFNGAFYNFETGEIVYTTSTVHGFRRGETLFQQPNRIGPGKQHVARVLSPTQFTTSVATAPSTSSSGDFSLITLFQGGAVTGGCFYNSTAFPLKFRNSFFYGDFNSGQIMRATLDQQNKVTAVNLFVRNIANCVDVTMGPDGALYYTGANDFGIVYRLTARPSGQQLIVSPTEVKIAKGGRAVFNVSLAEAPPENVTIAVTGASSPGDPPAAPATTLTFTAANHDRLQTVELTADAGAEADGSSVSFTVAGEAIPAVTVTAHVVD